MVKWLFVQSAVLLSCIGIVFVYSASAYWSEVHYAAQVPFYLKQLLYFGVAIVLFIVMSKMQFLQEEKWWRLLYVVAIILLVLVLVPGVGIWRNGSRSWIGLGPLTFQPAELAKVATLIYMSQLLAKRKRTERIVQVKHFIVLGIPVTLLMIQPDFGSAFILLLSVFVLLFIAGYPLKFYAFCIVSGAVGVGWLIASAPYRLARIEAFLNPWKDPLGSGFQAVQSLLAIGPAGLFGHGFLKSRQKYLYLPEPQNDFIFSIVLEETGLIGGLVVICIFVCFLVSGYKLASKVIYKRAFYVITALVSMLGMQAGLNIGVVIGLLPVTGVTLPFISYGGTSLVSVWFVVATICLFSEMTVRKGDISWKK